MELIQYASQIPHRAYDQHRYVHLSSLCCVRLTESFPMTSGQLAPLAGGALALLEALHSALVAQKSHTSEHSPLEDLSQRSSDYSFRRIEYSGTLPDTMTRTPSPASLEMTIETTASVASITAAYVATPQTAASSMQSLPPTHTRCSRDRFSLLR